MNEEEKELICVQCKLPIFPNTLYTKNKNGEPAHFRHLLKIIVATAVDASGPIGTTDEKTDKISPPKENIEK